MSNVDELIQVVVRKLAEISAEHLLDLENAHRTLSTEVDILHDEVCRNYNMLDVPTITADKKAAVREALDKLVERRIVLHGQLAGIRYLLDKFGSKLSR